MPRPNGRDPQTSPAAFLGARLRQARIDAGFRSQDALAVRLGFDRSVITKTETGERPPTDDVLAAWLAACGMEGIPSGWVVTLAKRGDGPVPTWFEDWLDAERVATMLKYWSPIIVPALFHTDAYARALLVRAQTDTSTEAIDALVTARLDRACILDRADPPDVVALIDELVLHRLIGTAETMHEQLTHMAELAERPYVCVQIVPTEVGATAGLSGAMNLASCDGTPDVLHTDAVPEGHTAESRSLVHGATIAFERIRGYALPRAQSHALIVEVANEKWKT